MKPDCQQPVSLSFYHTRSLVAEFSGGRMSSDGGLLLLRQVDEREGITQAATACLRGWRVFGARPDGLTPPSHIPSKVKSLRTGTNRLEFKRIIPRRDAV